MTTAEQIQEKERLLKEHNELLDKRLDNEHPSFSDLEYVAKLTEIIGDLEYEIHDLKMKDK
jgi:hypothetical protein